MNNKILYKRPQTNCHFWGARSKSRELRMIPAHSTTNGAGRPPKPPLRPDLPICPYPHPCKEPGHPPWRESKGTCYLFSLPPCCSTSPSKALLESLVWSLVNFYWLKNPRAWVGNNTTGWGPIRVEFIYYEWDWVWVLSFGHWNLKLLLKCSWEYVLS